MIRRAGFGVLSRSLKTGANMAAPTNSQGSKKIFAPGENTGSTQAKQFIKGSLELSSLTSNPFTQFHNWFQVAVDAEVPQCEACTLSTAELPSGRVSSRVVYLKELDERGFVIYSNWGTSRKAADVASNPYASLCFWWRELERQVRVEGPVERLLSSESQVYYDTRIRSSRIGAWASEQSKVLQGREELENRVNHMEQQFEGRDNIPVPEFWGGLRVLPDTVEFWQGRQSRLHDRFVYSKSTEKPDTWAIERLSP